jgi:Flp pilus assembly protein TadG
MVAARVLSRIAKMLRDRRGVAAVEMALASPVLLVFICGTFELTQYIATHVKTAQTAATVSDVVARYEAVTADSVKAIFDVSGVVMGDRRFGERGVIVLSSVARVGRAAATVSWQCRGGGKLAAASLLGTVSRTATLPDGFVLDEGDNVIIAEVFFRYAPTFSLIPIGERTLRKTAIFRPRLGALTTAPGC